MNIKIMLKGVVYNQLTSPSRAAMAEVVVVGSCMTDLIRLVVQSCVNPCTWSVHG